MNRLSRPLEFILEWFLMILMVVLTAIVVIAVIYRKLDASLSW
ncbi:MAG: TRAP transporter small permease, partial [Granulosicoccus sp.]|nr:TRAP transporter small permease [Granulosicoccus sp.]